MIIAIRKLKKFPYFIAIPATCGTGAESSPYAIIKDKDIPKKKTMERAFFIPKAVILDVDSLNTLDKKFRVATALDTLVHILEVHTSTTANNLIRINTRGALLSFT
ncbi:iron-containing alcohol dehydrogenase [Clostridium sporogenes]